MLEAKSDKWSGIHIAPGWTEPYPLHIRYEGGKTMSWGNDNLAPVKWDDAVEGPKVT
jgi:hypothetical protein